MSSPSLPTTLLQAAQTLATFAWEAPGRPGGPVEAAIALVNRAAAAPESGPEPPYMPGLPPPALVQAHAAQGGVWMELYLDRADSLPRLVRLAYDEARQRVCEARNDGVPTYVLEDGPWAYRPCLPSGMPIFWAAPTPETSQNPECPVCQGVATSKNIERGQILKCEGCKSLLVARSRVETVLGLEELAPLRLARPLGLGEVRLAAPWVQLRPGGRARIDNQGEGLPSSVQGPFQIVMDGGGPLLTLRNAQGKIAFAPIDELTPVGSP